MANKLAAMLDSKEAARPQPQGQTYTVGQLLPLGSVRTDGGTQARAGLDDATVAEYAEAWLSLSHRQNGFLEMPPIVVFHDGSSYWLADGFHRVEAYKRFVDGPSASASPRAIRAVIQQGTQRDAILFACGANDTHGLRRTQADKRRAIERLLNDDEWKQWSDSEIARRCQVSHPTVATVRRELYPENLQDSRTVERSGTTYQQKPPAQRTRELPPPERRGEPQRLAPLHPDDQHLADVQRILKEAANQGERTGTAMYQEAYGHARQIGDVALYNRAMAMVDRAVEGKPAETEGQPKIPEVAETWKAELLTPAAAAPAPLRRPRRPTSADSSAVMEYLEEIEAYATGLEHIIRTLTS